MAHNPLPPFLRYVRKAAASTMRPGGGPTRIPLGNNLPQDGGITGRMPRRTMERRTGEDDLLVDPAAQPADGALELPVADTRDIHGVAADVARTYAARPDVRKAPVVVIPPAINESVPPPVGVDLAPRPLPVGPMVSRADANEALRQSGLRPEEQFFRSGHRAADLEDRRAAVQGYEPQKRGWWANTKAALLPALLAGLRTGDPLGALGGVVGGVTVATADRRLADKSWKARELAKVEREQQHDTAREKDRLDLEEQRARVGWLKARPGLEGKKIDAQAVKRQQDALQREISNRLKEPRTFDPADAYDADLAERAQAAGVHFAPGAFGDFKNPATLEVLDASDPTGTRKTRLIYDREGGGWKQLEADGRGVQTGYVQPVGADGMTEAQRRGDADRDAARDNTEAYRKQLLGLSTDRLHLAMSNGLGAAAKRRFDVETNGLFERRRQIETQIQDYNTRAAKAEISGSERDRRTGELRAELEKITGQIDDARSEALGSMSDASSGAAPAGGSHVSRAKFRAKYPQFKGRPDAEVDTAIRASGYEPMP